ncbi:MAG: hypothetical protein FWC47_02140, partial [Oscillospiraceae bacterium]|nr:hypothetical protein [Oscillospiraceae bacterium]
MKKAICLLISVNLLLGLTSCGQPSGSSNQSTTSSSTAATQTKPIQIYRTDAGTPEFDAMLADLKAKTGVDAVGVQAPSDYNDFVTKTTAMLASGDDSMDILWLGEM